MLKPKNVKFLNGNKQLYEQFEKHHVIGHGNSFVFQVKNQQGQSQCVKEVILDDKMNQFIFIKEIQLLNKLKSNPHPNIIEFKGSYTLVQKKTQGKTIKKGFIQMQKGLTNLKTYLSQRKQAFNQDQITNFMCQMLDAFAHLQKIQVAHRDIKPSNILIFQQKPLLFKICDVGAGTAVGECDNTKERTVIGTPYYLSPELFLAFMDKRNLANYKAYKSDVYSLGLLFIQFCLFNKITDRMKNQEHQTKQKIKLIKQKYPNVIGLGKTLRNMLEFEVSKRMDFIQLKNFVTSNNLLRNKIDKSLTLSASISQKINQNCILIQGIQELDQLNAIVSTKSKTTCLKIHIQPKINPLKANEKQLLENLSKIRHMKLTELIIDIQICDIQDRHLKLISQALQKNTALKKLFLNFWNNQITNESFAVLLKFINNLSLLEELRLFFPSNNLKIDEKQYSQSFKFNNLPNLKKFQLNLSFNNITSDGLICMLKDLSASTSLQTLSLNLQSIRTNPVHFGKAAKHLINLQKLKDLKINISSNSIRDEGMFALSDILPTFKNLNTFELILRNCQIQDKGYSQFIKSLSQNKHLSILKLNLLSNELTQKSMKSSCSYLQKLTCLSDIDLNFSNNSELCDSSIRLLCKCLIPLPSIVRFRLILDSINLSAKGCLYLGRLISQSPLLENLQISLKHSQIKLQGVQYICAGLLKVKRIRKLRIGLEATNIGDQSANYIAMTLLKMRHLNTVDLNLDDCQISALTVQNIIKAVKQCSRKTDEITINLRRNQQIKLELYEQIKKDIEGGKIAIRIDNPLHQ